MSNSAADHAHGDHKHHITSMTTLIATFAALVALTFLTSALAQVNLGRADIWVTLGIATVKAALVAVFFMHLAHDKGFNAIILLSTLGFATLFICFALMDKGQYQPQIDDYNADKRQAAAEMSGS